MLQLPELYSRHLKKQFNYPQYLILLILLNLLQNLKTVRLEELARCFPSPIKLKSRVKKLQRFLSLKQFNIKKLWFPIISSWIEEDFNKGEVIFFAIDRSQWQGINLLMVSLMSDNRGIPIYFQLLPKKGNSNLAAKYGKNYRQKSCKEPWYILTNLESLSAATSAYSKRMGGKGGNIPKDNLISPKSYLKSPLSREEMFRDFKRGGYNLEITQVTGNRLIALILLISLAYCLSIFKGKSIKLKGVSKYVTRPTEPGRTYRRHSNFSMGLHGQNWVDSMVFFQNIVRELLRFSTAKNDYYRQGMRAVSLIQSAL